MKYPKDHEFHGPDGQGYRLTRDVDVYEMVMADQFEAFGGAPKPVSGEVMPEWLHRQIFPNGL